MRPITQLSAGTLQTIEGEGREMREDCRRRCIRERGVERRPNNAWRACVFNQPYAARSYRFGQHLAFSGRPQVAARSLADLIIRACQIVA